MNDSVTPRRPFVSFILCHFDRPLVGSKKFWRIQYSESVILFFVDHPTWIIPFIVVGWYRQRYWNTPVTPGLNESNPELPDAMSPLVSCLPLTSMIS
jgi:hypothetical protein